jgi:FkbM family methyltransferase
MADQNTLADPVEVHDHAKSTRISLSCAPGQLRPGRGQPVSARRIALTAGAVMLVAKATRFIEPELIGLRDLVKPGSVCIDIGAAAGLYTVALSRLAGPSGEVHSVEPVTFAHSNWTKLLGSRSSENVKHHVTALGAEPGRGTMSVPVGKHGPVTGRSFLEFKTKGVGSNAEFAGQMEVAVDVQTLDGLCDEAGIKRLDFVKIDVEGAEPQVLAGMARILSQARPAVFIEFHDETGWAGRSHLLSAGYDLFDAADRRRLSPSDQRVYHCLALPARD